LGQPIEAVHYESLQKDDSQKNEDWRKINAAEAYGNSLSNLVKYGFGYFMNEANDGIVWIGAYPRQNCTGDNYPHENGKDDVQDFGDCY
jgi:hypothetical protein